jgi:2-amino-4-hydroxy-6-hydroxymethyldihydropteridine diphosphokinase
VDRAVAVSRPVAIAIGSNLGDRQAAIGFAIDRLSRLLANVTASKIVETEPLGPDGRVLSDQPPFLNLVITGTTTLPPRQLLEQLLAAEREFGRERPYPGAPRTLDLDLILYGDQVIDEPGLQVPHPRFRSRYFVLGPLAQIAPEMLDPVTGRTVTELLKRLLSDETG